MGNRGCLPRALAFSDGYTPLAMPALAPRPKALAPKGVPLSDEEFIGDIVGGPLIGVVTDSGCEGWTNLGSGFW